MKSSFDNLLNLKGASNELYSFLVEHVSLVLTFRKHLAIDFKLKTSHSIFFWLESEQVTNVHPSKVSFYNKLFDTSIFNSKSSSRCGFFSTEGTNIFLVY